MEFNFKIFIKVIPCTSCARNNGRWRTGAASKSLIYITWKIMCC